MRVKVDKGTALTDEQAGELEGLLNMVDRVDDYLDRRGKIKE